MPEVTSTTGKKNPCADYARLLSPTKIIHDRVRKDLNNLSSIYQFYLSDLNWYILINKIN